MTGHQQHIPSRTKDIRKYHQSSETSIFELVSVPIAQPGTVSIFTPPQDSHGAMWQWGSHCILGETLSYDPLRAHPYPHNPPTILPARLQKILWPPGHHTAQNNRTHQHFHLHPRASSDTAAAAVRPLTGTDRVPKSTKAIVGTPPFPSSDTSTDGARLG